MSASESIDSFIEAQRALMVSSKAWDNSFFQLATELRRSSVPAKTEVLQIVCNQYLYFTENFPDILCSLAARTRDNEIRALLISILYSELGGENYARAHPRLFRDCMKSVQLEIPKAYTNILTPSTTKLVRELRELYAERPINIAIGAQFMLEAQADNMLRRLKELFHFPLTVDDTFFTAHETDEILHDEAMQRVLIRLSKTESSRRQIAGGCKICLQLFGDFWEGVFRKISSVA